MKRLILTLGLLLVSAALLGTSTFAWFSMNTSVTATGMQVTAKSNAKFLLIGDDSVKAAGAKTDAADRALTDSHTALYATTSNTDKKCYPVAYYETASTLNGHATEAKNWYTTTSDKMDTAVSGSADVTKVDLGDAKYMLTYKMYLTLSKDSEDFTGKVKITATFSSADEAVKAYVTVNGEHTVFDSATTTYTTKDDVNIKSTTAVEVVAYVYIDGNGTNVNSKYVADVTAITGSLKLTFDLVL